MANLSAQLQQLQQLPNSSATERSEGYNNLFDSIIASNEDLGSNLVAYVQSITSDNIGVISSRPLLTSFVTRFCTISDNDVKIEAGYSPLT
jgi:COP9 signalosome complex subunit 4